MRITAIETIHLQRGITVHAGPIQWLWVRIHTDSGLAGLGETYPHPEAEKAVVQRSLAPVLLGRDPSQIDRLWADMLQAVSFSGWAGAEMRAISAVDIALWDLAGQGRESCRSTSCWAARRAHSIRTYNTCYDHIDFLTEPVRLARELAKSGIHAMKIWPFDPVAKETGGQYITADQMRRGNRAAAADPRGVRRFDGCGHGVSRLLESAVGHPDRAGAGAVRADVAGGDAAAGQSGRLSRTGRRHAPAAVSERAADDALRISRTDGESGGAHHHAGYLLVRRHLGGEEDRDDGRDLLPAGRAA